MRISIILRLAPYLILLSIFSLVVIAGASDEYYNQVPHDFVRFNATLVSGQIDAMTIGDFNDDGKLDLLVANGTLSASNLTFLYNDGAYYDFQKMKTVYRFTTVIVPAPKPILSLTSWNSQLFAGSRSGEVYQFYKDGSGKYSISQLMFKMADNEGILGLVRAYDETNSPYFYISKGSTLWKTNDYGTIINQYGLDANSELTLDRRYGTPYVIVGGDNKYIQARIGNYGTVVSYLDMGSEIDGLSLADLDNDKRMDIVSVSGLEMISHVRASSDGYGYSNKNIFSEKKAKKIVAGDFDGDGDVDIAYSQGTGPTNITILENTFQGRFKSPTVPVYSVDIPKDNPPNIQPILFTFTFSHPWYDYTLFNFTVDWNESNYNFINRSFGGMWGVDSCSGQNYDIQIKFGDIFEYYRIANGKTEWCRQYGSYPNTGNFVGNLTILPNKFYLTDLLNIIRQKKTDLSKTEWIEVSFYLNVSGKNFSNSLVNVTVESQIFNTSVYGTGLLLTDKVNDKIEPNIKNPTSYYFGKYTSRLNTGFKLRAISYPPLPIPEFTAISINVFNDSGAIPIDSHIVYMNGNYELSHNTLTTKFLVQNIGDPYSSHTYAKINYSTSSKLIFDTQATKESYFGRNEKYNFTTNYDFSQIHEFIILPNKNLTKVINFSGLVDPTNSIPEATTDNDFMSTSINITFVNDSSDFTIRAGINQTHFDELVPGQEAIYINYSANVSNIGEFGGFLDYYLIVFNRSPNCCTSCGNTKPECFHTQGYPDYDSSSTYFKPKEDINNSFEIELLSSCNDLVGTYDWWVKLIGSDGSEVISSSPDYNAVNNYYYGGKVTVSPSKPDLRLYWLPYYGWSNSCSVENTTYVIPISGYGHRRVKFNFLAENQGGTDINSPISIKFYNNKTKQEMIIGKNFSISGWPSRIPNKSCSEELIVNIWNITNNFSLYAIADPDNNVMESLESNNYMFFDRLAWMEPKADDIYIEDIDGETTSNPQFKQGETFTVYVNIINEDFMTTDPFNISFYIDGKNVKTETYNLSYKDYWGNHNLDWPETPNERLLGFTFTVPADFGGLHTINFSIDPENVINEGNEFNNNISTTFLVKSSSWSSNILFQDPIYRGYQTNVTFSVTNNEETVSGFPVAIYGIYANLVDNDGNFISDLSGKIFDLDSPRSHTSNYDFDEYSWESGDDSMEGFCFRAADDPMDDHYDKNYYFIVQPQTNEARSLSFIMPTDVPLGSKIEGKIDKLKADCENTWVDVQPVINNYSQLCVYNGDFELGREGWTGWDINITRGSAAFGNNPVTKVNSTKDPIGSYSLDSSRNIDGSGILTSRLFFVASDTISFDTIKGYVNTNLSVRIRSPFRSEEIRPTVSSAWKHNTFDLTYFKGSEAVFEVIDANATTGAWIAVDNIACSGFRFKQTSITIPIGTSFSEIYLARNGIYAIRDADGGYSKFHRCKGYCKIYDIAPGETKNVIISGDTNAYFFHHTFYSKISNSIQYSNKPALELRVNQIGDSPGKLKVGYTEGFNVTIVNNDAADRTIDGIFYNIIYDREKVFPLKVNLTKVEVEANSEKQIYTKARIPEGVPIGSSLEIGAYRIYNLSPIWHETGVDNWAEYIGEGNDNTLNQEYTYSPSGLDRNNNLTNWRCSDTFIYSTGYAGDYIYYNEDYFRQVAWISNITERASAIARTDFSSSAYSKLRYGLDDQSGCSNLDNRLKIWINDHRLFDPLCGASYCYGYNCFCSNYLYDAQDTLESVPATKNIIRGSANPITFFGGGPSYQTKAEMNFYEKFGSFTLPNAVVTTVPAHIIQSIDMPLQFRFGYEEQVNVTVTNNDDDPFKIDYIEYNALIDSQRYNLKISARNFTVPPLQTKIITDFVYIPEDFPDSIIEVIVEWVRELEDSVFATNANASINDALDISVNDTGWGLIDKSSYSSNYEHSDSSKFRKWIWPDDNVLKAEAYMLGDKYSCFSIYPNLYLNSSPRNGLSWYISNSWGNLTTLNLKPGPQLFVLDGRVNNKLGMFGNPKLRVYYNVSKTGGSIIRPTQPSFIIKFGILSNNTIISQPTEGISVKKGEPVNITIDLDNRLFSPRLLNLYIYFTYEDVLGKHNLSLYSMNVSLDGQTNFNINKIYKFNYDGLIAIDANTLEYMNNVYRRTGFNSAERIKNNTFYDDFSWGFANLNFDDINKDAILPNTYYRKWYFEEPTASIVSKQSTFYLNNNRITYTGIRPSLYNTSLFRCCYMNSYKFASFNDCLERNCGTESPPDSSNFFSYPNNQIAPSVSLFSEGNKNFLHTLSYSSSDEETTFFMKKDRKPYIKYLDLSFDDAIELLKDQICLNLRSNGDYDALNVSLEIRFQKQSAGPFEKLILNPEPTINVYGLNKSIDLCFQLQPDQGFDYPLHNFSIQIDKENRIVEWNKNNNIKYFGDLEFKCPNVLEVDCYNGVDDDCDGATDCNDADCYTNPYDLCCVEDSDCNKVFTPDWGYEPTGKCTEAFCGSNQQCDIRPNVNLCTSSGCARANSCEVGPSQFYECIGYTASNSSCYCNETCTMVGSNNFVCQPVNSNQCNLNWDKCSVYKGYTDYQNCHDATECTNIPDCGCHNALVTCNGENLTLDNIFGGSVCS